MKRISKTNILAVDMVRILQIFLAVLFSSYFLGCSASYRFMPAHTELPAHLPPSDPIRLKFLQKLEQDQIQVIQQGQYILISIPSVLLFAKHSPLIQWSGYSYLNDVACYLKSYRKIELNINSYDSCCDKHQRMLALTLLRATNVADYLLSQSIDARMVFTRGMGNDKPIMRTNDSAAYFANSRVEILFKEEII